IKWADAHFAYKYGNGEKPIKKKKFGREHARQERIGWFRHFVSWSQLPQMRRLVGFLHFYYMF
ncbi:hypothetical protein Q8G35_28205, partial [Peribacillus simplex]|nr:hypothetical protein [Peribacillus simplex]